MPRIHETQITPMRIRTRRTLSAEPPNMQPSVDWTEPPKKNRAELFLKNLTVASALVLCAVTLRTGAVPSLSNATDAVMTAATDNSLLDEQLGKLSFVSALFPEAVLVFGESSSEQLSMPVSGGVVVHAWSESEPYMTWRTSSTKVTSSLAGEVSGVYHGNGDELLVQVSGNDGLSCMYGNLSEVYVQTGDRVTAGDLIGDLMKGEDFVFEVRRDGISIDPALYLSK